MATYAGFIAFSAYFGSIGMISGLPPVGASLARRLPFQSPVFAGIALAVVVGLPASFVAALSWRRHPGGRTRLVTRLRQRYRMTPAAIATVILAEFGDYPMMRKMLVGIKQRAETTAIARTSRRWRVN